MSLSSSPSSCLHGNQRFKQDVIRNTITFPPSIWGDQFLSYNERKNDETRDQEQLVEELKEKVRKQLVIDPLMQPAHHIKLLRLIDAVRRLGVSYHFEEEIEECLNHIYETYGDQWIDQDNLEGTSLWFRLLRQQGFNVSSGIFYKYKNESGNFSESMTNDIQGMLSLYESTHMRVESEGILDEALEFTRYHLKKIIENHICSNDIYLESQIRQALDIPIRKRLPRLEALHYMPIYQQQDSHDDALLKFSKLDFNSLQELHRKELSQISNWWKNLDVSNKLPFARDRIVEGYFWILGVYFEPQHSQSRIFLMKTCNLITILDDTYDNYGTYEELEILTKAVETWSTTCMDMLPEYMKVIYQEVFDVYKEAEDLLQKKGNIYRIYYIKQMVKEYTQNLLIEAKWTNERYIPTVEEHISVTMVTVGYPLIIMLSYAHREDLVTEDTFKWLSSFPPIIKACSMNLRLMDDIATHKEEQERNHVASSIECYMKQYRISKDHACELLLKLVEDNWKVINKESLRPTDVPVPLLISPLNFARVCDQIYTRGNNYTHAGKEMIEHIKALIVNPICV